MLLSIVTGDAREALKSTFPGFLGTLIGVVAQITTRRAVQFSDGVVYVTREYLQKVYPPPRGALVLSRSNVRFGEGFPPAKSQPPRIDKLRPIKVIAVGSQQQRYKGHHDLLEAVRALLEKDIFLDVLIVGDGKRHKELVKQAATLDLNNVRFLHSAGLSADLAELVRKFDIFTMPSHTEGMPKALLEAMAVGTFCIGTNVGGIPEVLPPKCLFAPKSPSELAACLQFFIENKEDLDEMWREQQKTISHIQTQNSGDFLLTKFVSSWVEKSLGPRSSKGL